MGVSMNAPSLLPQLETMAAALAAAQQLAAAAKILGAAEVRLGLGAYEMLGALPCSVKSTWVYADGHAIDWLTATIDGVEITAASLRRPATDKERAKSNGQAVWCV